MSTIDEKTIDAATLVPLWREGDLMLALWVLAVKKQSHATECNSGRREPRCHASEMDQSKIV